MITFSIGDITGYHFDAIVCPTDENFSASGSIDEKIRCLADTELDAECKSIGKCPVGGAVMTNGYKLLAKHIIHTAAPKWSEAPCEAEYLLAACYLSCLDTAENNKIETIAFPSIGTGACGFPDDIAAKISAETIVKWYAAYKARTFMARMHIELVFRLERKLDIYRKQFCRSIVRVWREYCSPVGLAGNMGYTLPLFIKEEGGMVELPDAEKELTQKYSVAFYGIHEIYCDFATFFYDLIGRPDYYPTFSKGL